MELPAFTGTKPLGWISKAEKFFEVHEIHSFHKIQHAFMSMEGAAMRWFYIWSHTSPDLEWESFSTALFQRFGFKTLSFLEQEEQNDWKTIQEMNNSAAVFKERTQETNQELEESLKKEFVSETANLQGLQQHSCKASTSGFKKKQHKIIEEKKDLVSFEEEVVAAPLQMQKLEEEDSHMEKEIAILDAGWIGRKEENPAEAKLEFPKELYEGHQAEYDFKGGADAGAASVDNQGVPRTKIQCVEQESPKTPTSDDVSDSEINLEDIKELVLVCHSTRNAKTSYAEISSGNDSCENHPDLSAHEEKVAEVDTAANDHNSWKTVSWIETKDLPPPKPPDKDEVTAEEKKPYEEIRHAEKEVYLQEIAKEKLKAEAIRLLADKQKLKTAMELIKQSVQFKLGNGQKMKTIGCCDDILLDLAAHTVKGEFFVFDLGSVDIILGVDWLETFGEVKATQLFHLSTSIRYKVRAAKRIADSLYRKMKKYIKYWINDNEEETWKQSNLRTSLVFRGMVLIQNIIMSKNNERPNSERPSC